MSKNLFWKGMLYGALAGGAVTLFDKQTRQAMSKNVQKTYKHVSYAVRHPGEIGSQVKETAEKIRTTIEQVSEDFTFIASKVDDLRELTPKVTGMVNETKEALLKNDETDLMEDLLKEQPGV